MALFKRHNPDEKVDETVVKRKIQGLRTVYKKELNKVEKSKKSGAGTDEVYVPSLWYFDLLAFTRDQEVCQQDVVGAFTAPEGEVTAEVPDTERSTEMPGPSNGPRWKNSTRKQKDTLSSLPDLLGLAHQILKQQANTAMDSFSIFAASRLRQLDERQRFHAERIIFETLNKAAAGELDESTTVINRIERQQGINSWPPSSDTVASTPWRRIGPHQNPPLVPPPQYPLYPQTFMGQLASPSNQGYNPDRFVDL